MKKVWEYSTQGMEWEAWRGEKMYHWRNTCEGNSSQIQVH